MKTLTTIVVLTLLFGKEVLGVLFLSSLAGGLFGTGLILFRGGKGSAPIPFGVFLAPIGFLALIYGKAWVAWYLGFAAGTP